ncbi:haloalkane dehalogenase [Pseudomarimonas salicorniae]|uniref:Haloalkane dehalogenase n=1 Tax=Pseudomarimonas salicorniae TaxID=2933270 RepID=A0ABT0GM92_9GAMM|nr:haloalkane dehalogenase [Lysobacter sp. CAU 1642]MCK7595636.1 haloalkane dehalogenase [Lysobacter sp. CAU 1642]
MDILRTPDERFAGLPGYDFAPHYVDDLPGYAGLRVHYLDEGPKDAAVNWLCLHGQPTWSYLYRKMIPVFSAAGHRVIAPDLLGFGRSDKPVDEAVYGFDFHRGMLMALIERLDLRGIRLACQDWGGLLGLTLPMDLPGRFAGLLVMNTALATGDVPLGEGFIAWRAYNRGQPDLDIAGLMQRSTPILTGSEAAAYAAPFPDARHKAGVRRFPELVPDHPDAEGAALSRRARQWWNEEWRGPSLMAIGMQDPVLGPPAMRYLRRQIHGCPEPIELAEAGHFVQEWGAPIAEAAITRLV